VNKLKQHQRSTIETLVNNGKSQREIERHTGFDRKTIRRYIGMAAKSPMATGSDAGFEDNVDSKSPTWPPIPKEAKSACESHREFIEEAVRAGRNAVAIYQDLVDHHGFEHKYNSVKRFVRVLKKRDPEQYDVMEFLPGEEAQVDYGQGALTILENGKWRKPYLFVMTLKYSAKTFRKVVWKTSSVVWAQLHEEAFRFFGGCPQYIVLDNLKEGVMKPDIYEPELNRVYAAFLKHYEVIGDPARVRDPNRKGTVENAVKYTQNTALKGRKFRSIEEQNIFLEHWDAKWASTRVHGVKKRQVAELFLEEKPYLKALPVEGFRFFKYEKRGVDECGNVRIENSFYSALPAQLYSDVAVHVYDKTLEIFDKHGLKLRTHDKAIKPGSYKMNPEDRIFNPSRDTVKLISKASMIGPKTTELCEKIFNQLGRSGNKLLYGIVNLRRDFDNADIEVVAQVALDRHIISSKVIRQILLNQRAEKQKPTIVLKQNDELIRSSKDYQLIWDDITKGDKKNGDVYH